MSKDDEQDALKGAHANFVELIRILDEAMSEAAQIGDREMIERLSLARAAAENVNEVLGKLGDILSSDDEQGHQAAL